MKILLKISMLVAFVAITATNLQAQKFGHINTGAILTLMPGVEESDAVLKSYQDSLITAGEEKAAAFRTEVDAFMTAYNGGDIPPVKAQEKQAEFKQREQELVQYEQIIFNQVNQKRQELLEPLIGKLQEAIQEVGQEGNYTMIFETGTGSLGFSAMPFVTDSDDISSLVKAKLDIQ